jgi:hypothetical protein
MKIEFTSIIPKDKWGQPVLGIDCEYKENEAKMREDMMWDAAEMLMGIKIKRMITIVILEWQFTKWEQLGWDDPKTSVLNKWNQMHEVSNVLLLMVLACLP